MKEIVVFAGYCSSRYIQIARSIFPEATHELMCIYDRAPASPAKQRYLSHFDRTHHLSEVTPEFVNKIKHLVVCVTSTQERDVNTYIQALLLLGKITKTQAALYSSITDKKAFKDTLALAAPNLVPKVYSVTSADEHTIQFPAVLKPTSRAGSTFVKVIPNQAALDLYIENWTHRTSSGNRNVYDRETVLSAEEYIEGDQYSVNVYIDAHKSPTLCPIIRVVPAFQIEGHDTYSALQYTTDLPEAQKESLLAAITKICEIFDLASLSAHFDCVLTKTGWKFFEVGIRIGGKRQEIYELSHRFNHFQNDLLNRVGASADLGRASKSVCIITKASQKNGTLEEIVYTRKIAHAHQPLIQEDKIVSPGVQVKPVSDGGKKIIRLFMISNKICDLQDEAENVYRNIIIKVLPSH